MVVLLGLHTIAMLVFEHAQLKYGVISAIWLTLTTVLTVGYGDISAQTLPGQISTMLLLYTAAVFIVANTASLAVELRMERINRKRAGTWRWNLRDHVLIINSPMQAAERFFVALLTELRADHALHDMPVMILTDRFDDGLPDSVHDLGAVYYKGSPHNADALAAAGADQARYIVMLSDDENHPRSDSLNFDILLELHEMYTGAQIIAEVIEEGSRERFRRFGAHRLIRPVRSYPELIVRAMSCPGAEVVLEDLMRSNGNLTRRFNVRIREQRWSSVVHRVLAAGYGTPIGYIDESRRVVPNPEPDAVVSGRGLLVLSASRRPPTRLQVQDAVDSRVTAG